MNDFSLYGFLLLLLGLLVIFNCLMSKEIFNWTPSVKKQIALYLILWMLPAFGLYIANKLGGFGWFSRKKTNSNESIVSGGFMEADSVFNPGSRHQIELLEKQKSEIRSEKEQETDQAKK